MQGGVQSAEERRIFLDTPNRDITRIHTRESGGIHPEHQYEYRPEELKDLVRMVGFEVESEAGVCEMFKTMPNTSSGNIMGTTLTAELSIVIPVYRSAAILPALAERIEHALEPLYGSRFEVILVNDCSPDGSWDVLKQLATKYHWWKVVNLRKNVGQHNAIMVGLRLATGRYIVTMDDDLQHSPDDVPLLLAALSDKNDVCYAAFRSRHHALWKRLGSSFNDQVANRLLGKPKGLYLSPFKAMVSGVRDEVIKFTGPHVYLDGLILSSTSRITSIMVEHHVRVDGQSGYSLRKSISLWLKMATSFSLLPLRIASMTGIAFSVVGFLLAIALIIQRFTINAMPVGWSSLMVSAMILGGIQLLAIGVIGEYVGRVLLHVNGRPQAVIESTRNLQGREPA